MRPTLSVSDEACTAKRCPGLSSYLRKYLYLQVAAVIVCLNISAAALQSSSQSPSQKKTGQSGPSAPTRTTLNAQAATSEESKWLEDLFKDKALMADIQKFSTRAINEIKYPAPRTQSNILSRLPASSTFYAAFPNYGDTVQQALQIFQQELKESTSFREFLRKNKLDATEPKIESGVQQFCDLAKLLGDEVVITGSIKDKDPLFFVIAEVKKPEIKEALEKLNDQITDKNSRIQIVDPQALATITGKEPAILIRQDLVIMGFSASSLRAFNTQLDDNGAKFAASPLGQRLARSYKGSVSSVFGMDAQKLIGLIPPAQAQALAILEKSGFSDARYIVSENRLTGGKSFTQGEMAFSGPRHGIASWISAPAPMGGLDFVSSKAYMAGDVILKDFGHLFDDLQELIGPSAFASLPQMEAQLNINLRQDLLSKFSGEVVFEMQQPPMLPAGEPQTKPMGAFKFILRVQDPAGVQQTLNKILTASGMPNEQQEEAGVTLNILRKPSPSGQPSETCYFIMGNYLVLASSVDTAREALRIYHSGESLGKSGKLTASLQPGQPVNASAVIYQNVGELLSSMLTQLPPEVRQLATNFQQDKPQPNVFYLYGEPSSLKGMASSKVNFDMTTGLIAAAVIMPNLIKSRSAANEAVAVGGIRTVNTAERTYKVTYPAKGYAPSLASLGPPADGKCAGAGSPGHACLLDSTLGNSSCMAGNWCMKDGYRFILKGTCIQESCQNYVVTATPASAGNGSKSFCSVTDAVIRMHIGEPLTAPVSWGECKTWQPLQ